MFIPWQPIDVIREGRERRKRLRHWQKRYGLFIDHTYWVVEPAQAPFITGYGVLVSKIYHKHKGITPDLQGVYGDIIHDLARVLAKYNISDKNEKWKRLAKSSIFRRIIAYKVSSDLFNKVVFRSNRAIYGDSVRLSESNLSAAERSRIKMKIRKSNNKICIYDFKKDYLYKP
jgi:hypothetical protein